LSAFNANCENNKEAVMINLHGMFRVVAFGAAAALAACVVAPPRPEFVQQGPAYGADQRYCDRNAVADVFRPTTGNLLGSAAGAAAGGLVGSQFGKSSGNTTATIVGILGGALVGGAIARSMEPPDQACVYQALEHAPTGAPVEWQNPGNRSSYWVTPTQTAVQPDGTPCRYYTTEQLANGNREAYTGYACRQPDGHWQNYRR
jgi:surface antigen